MVGLIAGGVALWNESRKRRQEREHERKRQRQEREREREKQRRLSAAEVFKEMFVLQHEVEWLTWHALHEPQSVNNDMRHKYNEAVHVSIPKLLGQLAVLASLDEEAYKRLVPIADELFRFEGMTARDAIGLGEESSRQGAVRRLASRYEDAERLWKKLPLDMARVMKQADD
jgi:hypothetical protein